MAQRYLGREDGELFGPADYASAMPSAPLRVEDAVEIAAHLWLVKQSEVREVESRGKSSFFEKKDQKTFVP